MANQTLAQPKSFSSLPHVLAVLVIGVVVVFQLGVIALEKRESRGLAAAEKACGARSMTAKRVGRDIVCVAADGRQVAMPKRSG